MAIRRLLAGGCVRDLLCTREPADFDVTTDATPERVLQLFPRPRRRRAVWRCSCSARQPRSKSPRFAPIWAIPTGGIPTRAYAKSPAGRRRAPRFHHQWLADAPRYRRNSRLCRWPSDFTHGSSALSANRNAGSPKINCGCCAPPLCRAFDLPSKTDLSLPFGIIARQFMPFPRSASAKN